MGLFTLFSPLYWIWKIYTIKKTKLYSFRGRILAQVLNCSLCLCNSGRITAAHSSSFPSFLSFLSSFCFIKNYLLNHILHQALFWRDQLYEIQILLLFSLYRWGNWSLERLSFCPQTHICLSPKSELLCILCCFPRVVLSFYSF